jgi:ParB family transcriptional regulator, chromosome partitioning protein
MSRLFTTSPLILGIIEEVEINLLKYFKFYYRSDMGDHNELFYSIKEKGLLQPIIVRSIVDSNTDNSRYEIIAGHRRYEACKKLGWRKILCHIVELDDEEALEISLVENIQRKNLNPIEEAQAFKKYVVNFGWGGISDLALKLDKSPSHIDKRIRLLELPREVIDSILKSCIHTSTAEELLCVKDKNKQSALASLINRNSLSSRRTRKLIKDTEDNTFYDYNKNAESEYLQPRVKDIDEKTQRCFDKSIIALRTAMSKLGNIIESIEDNWMIYEILMQHKNMLHNQIDILIKEKMKL